MPYYLQRSTQGACILNDQAGCCQLPTSCLLIIWLVQGTCSHTQTRIAHAGLSAAEAFAAAARWHIAVLLARLGCHAQRLQLPASTAPGQLASAVCMHHHTCGLTANRHMPMQLCHRASAYTLSLTRMTHKHGVAATAVHAHLSFSDCTRRSRSCFSMRLSRQLVKDR